MQGVNYHHQIGLCVAWSTLKCPPGPSLSITAFETHFCPELGWWAPAHPYHSLYRYSSSQNIQAGWQNWNNTEFVVRTPELDVFLPLFLLALRSPISKAWTHIRMCAAANCKHCLVIVFPLFAVCVVCSNLIGPSEDYYEECSSELKSEPTCYRCSSPCKMKADSWHAKKKAKLRVGAVRGQGRIALMDRMELSPTAELGSLCTHRLKSVVVHQN